MLAHIPIIRLPATYTMAKQDDSLDSNYQYNDFDAKEYLNRRFTAPNGIIDEERGVQPFYLQCYHDFYQGLHTEWDQTKATALELGGGPAIYPLISAAPYVSEVIFAEYAEPNRTQVDLWRKNDPQAHDWSPYFKHVVMNLEGNRDPKAASDRQEELRSKIKNIVKGDISVKDPKDILEGVQNPEQFDIISFNFCAEVVCKNGAEYEDILRLIRGKIKPGGFLCSLISIEESWYINGDKKLPHMYLKTDEVALHCKRAGLIVRQSATFDIPKASQNVFNDCKGIHFFAVQRVD